MNVGEEFKFFRHSENLNPGFRVNKNNKSKPQLDYVDKKYLFRIRSEEQSQRVNNLIIKYNKNDDIYYICRIYLNSFNFIYNIKVNCDLKNIEDKIRKINLYEHYQKITSIKLNDTKGIFDEKNPFINMDSWIDIVFDCDLIFLYNTILIVHVNYDHMFFNNPSIRHNSITSSVYVYQIDDKYIEYKNSDIEKVINSDNNYYNNGIISYLKRTDYIQIVSFKKSKNIFKVPHIFCLDVTLIGNLYDNDITNVNIYSIDPNMNVESIFSCNIKIIFSDDNDDDNKQNKKIIFENNYIDVNNVEIDSQQIKKIIDNEKIRISNLACFSVKIESSAVILRYDVNYNK